MQKSQFDRNLHVCKLTLNSTNEYGTPGLNYRRISLLTLATFHIEFLRSQLYLHQGPPPAHEY